MTDDLHDGDTRAHLRALPAWARVPRVVTGMAAAVSILVGLTVIAFANGDGPTGESLPSVSSAGDGAVSGSTQLATTLGITLAALGSVVLLVVLLAVASSALTAWRRPREASAGASAGSRRPIVGDSMARQLSSLARLHSRGQLSDAEFAAAKRHLLDL